MPAVASVHLITKEAHTEVYNSTSQALGRTSVRCVNLLPLNWGLSLTRFMERIYTLTWMLFSRLHAQIMLLLASGNFYEKYT